MKVKRKSADGCARTKANGVVAASLRVACPAMNREPRKSVEPVDAGSCKKRPLCESGVRMVKLRCDDQLRATKKVPQNLNCDQIGGLSTAKLHSECSSLQEMHTNMNDHSYFLGQELTYLQEPIMESSVLRTRKRTSRLLSSSCNVEKTAGAYTKVITTGKVGGSKELFQERPSKLLNKVDAVASPHALLGEKCMPTSFKDKRTGNSEMGGEHDRPLLDTRYILLRRIDCNGVQTSECSVASCSTANYPSHNLSHQYNAYCRQEMDGCFDDAESSCILGHRRECFFPSKEEIGSEIHKLELHAYRSTLEALHASGPLSWEQEALMTNLRLNLNISNDEHLLELRKLVSSQSFWLAFFTLQLKAETVEHQRCQIYVIQVLSEFQCAGSGQTEVVSRLSTLYGEVGAKASQSPVWSPRTLHDEMPFFLLKTVLWWTFKETSLVLKADFEIDFLTWVRRLCGNAARLKAIKIGNMQKWMAQLDISGDFISEWSNVPFELAFLVKGNRGTAVAAAPAPAWYRCGSNELLDSYVQVVEKDDFSIE